MMASNLTTVRPLLSVWRSDIDKYVHERHLRFREDATNKLSRDAQSD